MLWKKKQEQTYDYICFSELAYELDILDIHKTENKIKRRLKYYNLASYDQARVDYIRQLKNDLLSEISLQSKSKYFSKSNTEYADLTDFDIEKMKLDFSKRHDQLTDLDMGRILNFAIYLYYLR